MAGMMLFLDITDPTGGLSKDTQRLIRSHVTREQHRKRRRSALGLIDTGVGKDGLGRDGQSSRSSPKTSSSPEDVDDTPSKDGSSLIFLTSDNPTQVGASRTRRLVRSHVTKWQHRNRRARLALDINNSNAALAPPSKKPRLPKCSRTPNNTEHLISRGLASLEDVVLQNTSKELGLYINSLGFDLRSVVDHYIYIADTHAPDFEDYYNMKGIVRKVWLPFLFSDTATISAVMLIAVCHKLSLLGTTTAPTALLRIKGIVMHTINQALEDPLRSSSDQVIVGVANMAVYEAVFGSEDIYHIHMQGLIRILRLRGGLLNLGGDGYLERVLIWYDTNCANLVGCLPYFNKTDYPTIPDALPPNEENFTVGLSRK